MNKYMKLLLFVIIITLLQFYLSVDFCFAEEIINISNIKEHFILPQNDEPKISFKIPEVPLTPKEQFMGAILGTAFIFIATTAGISFISLFFKGPNITYY